MCRFFESISSYFVTRRMAVWAHVFDARIPWQMMVENYAWLVGIDATLFWIGWLVFE